MKKFFVCSAIFTAMFLMISCGGSDSGSSDDNCTYGTYKCEGVMSYFCNNGWALAAQCANGCNLVSGQCNEEEKAENGCKKLYDCENDCYNDAHATQTCYDDCRSAASNNDRKLYDELSDCRVNYENIKANNGGVAPNGQSEKQYCATEFQNCGM